MAKYIEKADKLTLPVIALGGVTAFPAIPVNFELTDDVAIAAANAADATDAFVYLISLQEVDIPPAMPHLHQREDQEKSGRSAAVLLQEIPSAPDHSLRRSVHTAG